MDYKTAKETYDTLLREDKGWMRLSDGKLATRLDCIRVIQQNNENSSESDIEQYRRDV